MKRASKKSLEKASILYNVKRRTSHVERILKLNISAIFCAGSIVFLSSCASVSSVQPQVNNLAVSGRFDQALQILDDPKKYGDKNELLRLFDRGLVLHYAGQYQESIETFEEAKHKYEELYTQSLSQIAESMIWNDYAQAYRGEDFERVMVNVFQALNYAALGKFDEALVEARDVDSKLNAINNQYSDRQKNVYREDAFARFLMGILYESDGKINDAVISYRLSWEAYENDYKKNYGLGTPKILKENLLAAAESYGDQDLNEYRQAFSDISYVSLKEKKQKSEIIVVEYQGISPLKIPVAVPIPLPDGYISQIVFPHYQKQNYILRSTKIQAAPANEGTSRWDSTETAENIEAIAIKNLDNRKVRTMAKAILRPTGKYLVERTLERNIARDHGEGTANVVKILGSIFNMVSERADLRSWQTLPAQIRIGRLILEPGEYDVSIAGANTGNINLKAGEKKFFIVRH